MNGPGHQKLSRQVGTAWPLRAVAHPPTEVLAALALVTALSLGCQPNGGPPLPQLPAHSTQAKTTAPKESDQRAAPTAISKDLRAMCRRISLFTGETIQDYRKRLISHGLVAADRIKLAVQLASTVVESPQRTLLANRVCPVLADELGRVGGLSVSASNHPPTESASLTIDIENKFEMETFFDCIQVQISLDLGHGEKPVEYRDSFDSEGLVRVVASSETSQSLFVTAEKPDINLVLDLEVKPGEWFLLPVGQYRRITVRSKEGLWRPLTLVGLQNLWDMSLPSLPPRGEAFPPVSPPTDSVPGSIPREPDPGDKRTAFLQILSPADGAKVPRSCDVNGKAIGLEGTSVEVVVTPLRDIPYPQGRGLIRNNCWEVLNCLFGREGEGVDKGQRFRVKARSRSTEGIVVESPTITVTRE